MSRTSRLSGSMPMGDQRLAWSEMGCQPAAPKVAICACCPWWMKIPGRANVSWSGASSWQTETMPLQHDTNWIGTQKTDFWDRNQKFRYLIMAEVARRLVERPELVERGRYYLDTVMAGDKQVSAFYQAWKSIIDRPVEEIARRWLADTEEGDLLRANPPLFDVVEGEERTRISAEASRWAENGHRS